MTSVSNDLVLSSPFRRVPLLQNTPSLLKHLGNMAHVSSTCAVLVVYLPLVHGLLHICDKPQGEMSHRMSSTLITECPCVVNSCVLWLTITVTGGRAHHKVDDTPKDVCMTETHDPTQAA